MRYLSVCSGIEAATVAWHPLGWKPAAFSEIEPFPASVLAHHYPTVPNMGDMTKFKEWNLGSIDLLVGGTPCQSFSVAGLRKGLDDPRGNLMLTYLAIADQYRPRWLVWENVPGVLSSNGGRDFGTFLGGLGELGYGFAYRVLDAQYFGVAQRRRRVFVVGCLGDWRGAAAVLLERDSLSGNPAPSRKAGKAVAALTANGVGTCGADDNQGQAGHLIAFTARDYGNDATNELAPTMRSMACGTDGHQSGSHGLAIAFQSSQSGVRLATSHATLDANNGSRRHNGVLVPASVDECLRLGDPDGYTDFGHMAVRRLTPIECERLQGFPDNYTNVLHRGKPAADGPRYKALGNSMAVPVMHWIGNRIQLVEQTVPKLIAA